MVICLPQVFKDSMAEAPGALEGRNAIKETWQQNLARSLRNEPWVDVVSIKIIAQAAIPVIKFNTLVSVCRRLLKQVTWQSCRALTTRCVLSAG